jgi:hypothetical protein
MKGHCDRCRKPARITTLSRFNTDEICMECKKKEQAHPDYAYACHVEEEAVQNGNYNFPGIGKPADL